MSFKKSNRLISESSKAFSTFPSYQLRGETEVLEITEFDEVYFEKKIKEIQVPEPNILVFVFHDGNTLKKEWRYKSRSESWNEEARQKPRECSLKKLEGRS